MIRPPRPAYTLLEMILALSIALIILGAVYTLLNEQIGVTELARETVEESALARNILNRMASDIISSLGGVDPQQLPDGGGGSSGDDAEMVTESVSTPFNGGVEGSESVLILSASRAPLELLAPDKRFADSGSLPRVSDLRRISYWYHDGGKQGLAREELLQITGAQAISKPPEIDDPDSCVMAEEVRGVSFEFFDGISWQTGWDGSALAADGETPIGPPSAIRITLTIASRDGQRTRDYRRTVALPAGNNFAVQQLGF